jgi:hypothetical protein
VACVSLQGAGDVSGDYEVSYAEGWRVYEDGELKATLSPGEEESVELSGGVLELELLCAAEERTCPEEALWGEVEVTHPQKDALAFIQIINTDPEVGELGAQLTGFVHPDGGFEAFVGAQERCGGLIVGGLSGTFDELGIIDGAVAWDYPPGCEVGGVALEGELRLEAPFSAERR